jgi:hypothetical protein
LKELTSVVQGYPKEDFNIAKNSKGSLSRGQHPEPEEFGGAKPEQAAEVYQQRSVDHSGLICNVLSK